MLNHFKTAPCNLVVKTSLHQLIVRLLKKSFKKATSNQSSVINKIEQDVLIDAENTKLISLISELLDTVIANSRNGEIYITAERYSDTVMLSIQERNNFNGYALAYSVNSMEADASMLGGHISINGPQKKITTILFSFPNQPVAA